jgi:penicillin-binding protein 1C
MTRPRWKHRLKRAARALALLAGLGLLVGTATFTIAWYASPFPIERLEKWPKSPVVSDRTGRTLLATVASDGQWRLPVRLEDFPPRLIQATIAVEDERFGSHAGVDFLAIGRALAQNVAAGRTVSGASTLTMQVCRMLDNQPRTIGAKLTESFRALQLERLRTKRQILETYLNVAPYGGNLRGAATAAQAYFGKRVCDLSLGEAALLAGIPQSPARLRPDRHPAAARARRETVLRRMAELGLITELERQTAAGEPIAIRGPGLQPFNTPRNPMRLAPHAAQWALQLRPAGGQITIESVLQTEVERLVALYAHGHESSGQPTSAFAQAALPLGTDIAVVIIDIPTGDILALVGSADFRDPAHGQVNGALARRSPGSALKPFVYAAAFDAARLSPESIVYDLPIQRGGWSPDNFDRTFAGEIPAAEALRRSLNVPAIQVAEGTGIGRCVGLMEAAGIRFPPNVIPRGGLAAVVGSLEVRLLDLTNAYATLGRGGVYRPPHLFLDEPPDGASEVAAGLRAGRMVLDQNICAAIDEILSCRAREPNFGDAGQSSSDSEGLAGSPTSAADQPWFMWKTGTSSGRRDAWAVGHNRQIAVGVWVGRFSGVGSDAFTGRELAEPLLAAIFSSPVAAGSRTGQSDPPAPQPILVRNPLAPPIELNPALRITSPTNGAAFVAVDGETILHPRANRPGRLSWFLNGRLLPANPDRLRLSPGNYELRCVGSPNEQSAVRFVIVGCVPGTPR